MLSRHALRFHKRGRDGSGKCNVLPDDRFDVAGVVFRIDRPGISRLDRIEGRGYRRNTIHVSGLLSGRRYAACCYVAKRSAIDDEGIAFDWYRDLVIAGAEDHALPRDYIAALQAAPSRVDPNPRRRRQQLALLGLRYGAAI